MVLNECFNCLGEFLLTYPSITVLINFLQELLPAFVVRLYLFLWTIWNFASPKCVRGESLLELLNINFAVSICIKFIEKLFDCFCCYPLFFYSCNIKLIEVYFSVSIKVAIQYYFPPRTQTQSIELCWSRLKLINRQVAVLVFVNFQKDMLYMFKFI